MKQSSPNPAPEFTDATGRRFHYRQGHRIYTDGKPDAAVDVAFTPTWPPFEATRFQPKFVSLARTVHEAGFVAEEIAERLVVSCPDPRCRHWSTHGFWVGLHPDCWYIGVWAGWLYQGQDASRLPELCLLLLRNPPGLNSENVFCSEFPLPDTIREQFDLVALEWSPEQEERALAPRPA